MHICCQTLYSFLICGVIKLRSECSSSPMPCFTVAYIFHISDQPNPFLYFFHFLQASSTELLVLLVLDSNSNPFTMFLSICSSCTKGHVLWLGHTTEDVSQGRNSVMFSTNWLFWTYLWPYRTNMQVFQVRNGIWIYMKSLC